jgi:autotransporter-associated beta strand protein
VKGERLGADLMIKYNSAVHRIQKVKRSKACRPLIEGIEPRTLLSSVFWTGRGGDNNWDTPANWSTDSVPEGNDDVTINVSAEVVHSNQVTDFVRSLTSTEPLTISGGSLVLATTSTASADLKINGGSLTELFGGLTVGGLLTLTSGVLYANGASVTADGGILFNPPNNRGFMLDGGTLTNAAGQTATSVGSGTVIVADSGYVFNNLGTFLAEGNGAFGNGLATSDITPNPTWSFNNQGTFTKSMDTGEFDFGAGVALNVLPGGTVNVQTGTLGLMGGGTETGAGFTIESGATLDYSGPNPFTLDGGTTFSGAGSLTKDGPTTLVLPGKSLSFTGITTVEGGTLLVDGSQPGSGVSVLKRATLGGTGTVGAITTTGSVVSPGDISSGILNAQGIVSFDSSSIFTVALNGETPGATGYDQLNVTGAVNLGGSTLSASLGFTPTTATAFTIIHSTAPIVGTFSGLPDGSPLTIGAVTLNIIYAGDDVILTNALTVRSLARFGFHGQPTSLVLTFSAPLDVTRSQDVKNYRIVTLGGQGKDGGLVGHVTPVRAAVYDPSTFTVTLHPAQRLDLHNFYRLTVSGTLADGLTSSNGLPLAGQGAMLGTNYVRAFSGKILAGPALATTGVVRRREAALHRLKKGRLAPLRAGSDPEVRRRPETLRGEAQAGADAADRDRKLLDDLVDIRSAKSDDPDGSAIAIAIAHAFRVAVSGGASAGELPPE